MSVLRLVVIADGLDAVKLCEALIAVGVRPYNIHVTPGHLTPEDAKLGVVSDLPMGRLVVRGEHSAAGSEPRVFSHDWDHLVP